MPDNLCVTAPSPYEQRFGEAYAGLDIPFGALVYFKPGGVDASKLPEFHERTKPALFLGWKLDVGCKWSGQYRCWRLARERMRVPCVLSRLL